MNLFDLVAKITLDTSDYDKGLGDSSTKTQTFVQKIKTGFANMSTAAKIATGLASGAVVAFGKSCVESAATVKAQNAQFSAAFGELQDTATEAFNAMSEDTGILATRLKSEGTKAFSQFKGAGLDAADALERMDEFTRLAADGAAYYDMSLEETSELMRSFIRGNTEAGDRIGLFTSETQRNQAALDTLGKKYADCTEAEKQMIMLDIASSIYESSGAMGQASREADGYENVVGNLKESWTQFTAVIGTPILAAVVPVLQNITSGLTTMGQIVQQAGEKFEELKTRVQEAKQWMDEHQSATVLLVTAFGALTLALLSYNAAALAKLAADAAETVSIAALIAMDYAHAAAMGVATVATSAFGAVIGFVTSPVTLLMVAIVALIAVGVALYQNWDTVKAKAGEAWNAVTSTVSGAASSAASFVSEKFGNIKTTVTTAWNSVKTNTSSAMDSVKSSISSKLESAKSAASEKLDSIKKAFSEKMESARKAVKDVIDKIKGLFKFSWSLPKLKLPHISISGSFSLNPPSVPHFSISWYRKAMDNAMLLSNPTIFGMMNGNLLGGGEAGQEVVAGANTLMRMIQDAVGDRRDVSYTQIFNSPKALSRREIRRETRNMVREIQAAW